MSRCVVEFQRLQTQKYRGTHQQSSWGLLCTQSAGRLSTESTLIQKSHWVMCNACLDVRIRILAPKHHPAVSTRIFSSRARERVLRLPRSTANSIPLISLEWPLMRCRCLCAKLCFSSWACSGDSTTDTLREEAFKSLSYSDIEALVVKQCRLLELP